MVCDSSGKHGDTSHIAEKQELKKDIMKTKRPIPSLFLFITMLAVGFQSAAAQDDEQGRIFLSNALKSDPTLMQETKTFKVGDPIYFVLLVDPKSKMKVGDLVSTNPETKEKNVFICVDVFSSTRQNTCPGILKTPLSQDVLNGKSIVYPIIPAANDINAENVDEIKAVLKGLQGADGQINLTVTLNNFDTKAVAVMKYEVDVGGWNGSRWSEYLGLFLKRDNAVKNAAENDNLAKRKVIMTNWVKSLVSKRTDPALEKAIRAGDRAPILRIAFLTPGYDIIRNEFGIAVRKSIKTVYVYKWVQSGKCYAHWHAYGYESLGGGAFNDDLGSWLVYEGNYGTVSDLLIPGTDGFPSGQNWEVDCAPFEK
jgi:hypothetical protein